ncbi:MAG: hypothetical protein ABIT37_13040 [Luteolibacter sp.]
MNSSTQQFKTIRLLVTACAFLSGAVSAHATSIIFPTFSTPVLVDDMIVVTSPDHLHLLGVTRKGTKIWDMLLPARGTVEKHESGKVILIVGSIVSVVDPQNGRTTPWFNSDPANTRLTYMDSADLFVGSSEDANKKGQTLRVYDGTTHDLLLKQVQGETVAYADKEFIVVAKGTRKLSDQGYSFGKGWLEGFDRKSRSRLWKVEFKQQSWPFHDACRVRNHLVCDDGGDLMVIPLGGGEVHRKPADKPAGSIGPSGLRNENGVLVYLASELNSSDFNRSRQSIYRVSIPELKTLETKVVEVIEAARVETAGEYRITDALYRTACFRRDGSKVWEHFQMHRTDVVDGMIYFSDYEKGIARVGAIKVSDGKERILLSERVDSK